MLAVLDVGSLDEGPSEVTHSHTCAQTHQFTNEAALSQQVKRRIDIVQRTCTGSKLKVDFNIRACGKAESNCSTGAEAVLEQGVGFDGLCLD